MLNNLNFVGTPLSPQSTAFVAKGDLHHRSTILLINIIHSLTATIHSREEIYKNAITSFDESIDCLSKKVQSYEDNFSTPLEGYIENNRH
jgi:hypothetical protein